VCFHAASEIICELRGRSGLLPEYRCDFVVASTFYGRLRHLGESLSRFFRDLLGAW
jgi:hypothetical protein